MGRALRTTARRQRGRQHQHQRGALCGVLLLLCAVSSHGNSNHAEEDPLVKDDTQCRLEGLDEAALYRQKVAPRRSKPGTQPPEGVATGVDGSEILVRFTDYKSQEEQRVRLEGTLAAAFGEDGGWEWVPRYNPASRFPTDFGLVKLAGALTLPSLQAALSSVAFVRSVTEQQRIRHLLWRPDPPARAAGDGEGEGNATGAAAEAEAKAEPEPEAWSPPTLAKGDGRLQTKSSYVVHEEGGGDDVLVWPEVSGGANLTEYSRRHLLGGMSGRGRSISDMNRASELWKKGFSGAKVRMAVFDTGVRQDHPHFRNIEERSNWTHENSLNDGLGHGTFVAGLVASQEDECHGFAPDAELYAFRVFTNDQVSYTSWFLDAFNYAIATEMNIINLSIGGPDYLDQPFVEKVWELTSNNIIMVSAIGNDGPLYGTLNNPADQMDVIGVGGIDYADHIATFSSRGMSTWELPHGYGRVKPDVVAHGRDVIGSKIQGGCRSLSGTSVASPVVAGAVVLLASVVPVESRWNLLNPAVMKQALVESADPINGPHIHEQGAGKLNLLGAYEILKKYKPRASVVPGKYELGNCPYMWPYCRQPLYATAMPTILNATIVNGMGLTGRLEGPPKWWPRQNGQYLDVRFEYPEQLWPWTGYLAVFLRVKDEGKGFHGVASGRVVFTVVSPPGKGEKAERRSIVELEISAQVVPTPPRAKRLLWDNYHSVRYPPGYIPRDSLDVRQDILDWHADHPHTNYHDMYASLRDAGYYVEMLGNPFTCFDAENYHALLLVDSEEEYHPEEKAKLQADIETRGLSLLVFADWYNVDTMVKMRFFDDNTRSWWTPATGGANVPALNDLLAPFGIAFGDIILNGNFQTGRWRIQYASGANIVKFPKGGGLYSYPLAEKSAPTQGINRAAATKNHPVMGLLSLPGAGSGRITVYGDSNCLDSSHLNMGMNCFGLLQQLLQFTATGAADPASLPATLPLSEPLGGHTMPLPQRRTDVDFSEYSRVLNQPVQCLSDAPLHLQTPADGAAASGGGGGDTLPPSQLAMEGAVKNSRQAPGLIYPNISTAGNGGGAQRTAPEADTGASDGVRIADEDDPPGGDVVLTSTPKGAAGGAAEGSAAGEATPAQGEGGGGAVSATPLKPFAGIPASEGGVPATPEVLSGTLAANDAAERAAATSTPRGTPEAAEGASAGKGATPEGGGAVPQTVVPEEELDPQVLDENAQLQSATGVQVVKHSMRVDPTHVAENEEFGIEFRVMDARMKYMLVVTGGLLMGAMIGVGSRVVSGRSRSAARGARGASAKSSSRSRAGRSAALLSK